MISIGDIKDLAELGLSLAQGVKLKRSEREKRELVKALRTIYFERETIDLIRQAMNDTVEGRKEAKRRLKNLLLDGRYDVDRSVRLLRDLAIDKELTLKQKRLYEFICWGKKKVRFELFEFIEQADRANCDNAVKLLDDLNKSIEEIEDKLQ